MELWQIAIVLVAGLWAGTINTIVGSGSLVTFPVLVGVGISPVNAVVSNAIGLVAGGFSGAYGYRAEIRSAWRTTLRLIPASVAGAVIGAYLLLHLPESVFGVVAPVLILVAVLLVAFQPRLAAWSRRRKSEETLAELEAGPDAQHLGALMYVLVFATGIYGGYFTAAQGVILMGIFGVLLAGTMQQANAIKAVLSLVVNVVAAISYLLFAFERINWTAAITIAIGSTIGGWLGARIGRKLSPLVLRIVIVVIGLAAFVNLVRQVVIG